MAGFECWAWADAASIKRTMVRLLCFIEIGDLGLSGVPLEDGQTLVYGEGAAEVYNALKGGVWAHWAGCWLAGAGFVPCLELGQPA